MRLSSGILKTAFEEYEPVPFLLWSFGMSIESFQNFCPVISIDSTHLYCKCRGKVLVIIRVDANNHLFLLAFAIVEGENNDNWCWFMACIRGRVTQRADLFVILYQ